MLVAMNYTEAGWRYIATIAYASDWSQETLRTKADVFSKIYDEVYIINFDKNYMPLIEEIVLYGCRIQ